MLIVLNDLKMKNKFKIISIMEKTWMVWRYITSLFFLEKRGVERMYVKIVLETIVKP